MISPAEIAAAHAVPIARVVGAVVSLGRDGFGLCPFHDDHRPTNFHVYAPANVFVCFACGARGDPIEFVQRIRGVDFPTAVRELVGSWQPHGTWPQPTRKASRETEVPSFVSELWREATAPGLAKWYLESRGITLRALPEALRGHPSVLWSEDVGKEKPRVEPPWRAWWSPRTKSWHRGIEKPCMLAAITDAAGRITAVQRTWIEPRLIYDGVTEFSKGARCPDLSAGKKCLGTLGSGAVQLAAPAEIMGVSESIEDALAVNQLYRIACWASLGAHRMGNIEFPAEVKRIIIFADNDDTGRSASAKAETIYSRRGYMTQSEYPGNEYKDFCQMVMAR